MVVSPEGGWDGVEAMVTLCVCGRRQWHMSMVGVEIFVNAHVVCVGEQFGDVARIVPIRAVVEVLGA